MEIVLNRLATPEPIQKTKVTVTREPETKIKEPELEPTSVETTTQKLEVNEMISMVNEEFRKRDD